MKQFILNDVESRAIHAAATGDLSDPIKLMKGAGCDVRTFFEYGEWSGDFTKSDIAGVSFLGANLTAATFTAEQWAIVAGTGPSHKPAQFRSPKLQKLERGPDWVELVRAYNPNTDEALLLRAYVYSAQAHSKQTTASGEPYFGHRLEVAKILIDLRQDDATIVTALLHDTIEDTPATHAEIRELFGDEIASLVDGVTKLNKLDLISKEQAEPLSEFPLEMAKDLRVILVKLADRLHNMRTLGSLHPKRSRIAGETIANFAPLAGLMGMQKMRDELEDLAFEVLNHDSRTSIMRRLLKLRREKGDAISLISDEIEKTLARAGIEATLVHRSKHPYSVWRRMEELQVGFGQLSDIFELQIITEREADCYATLIAVNRATDIVQLTINDFISNPKSKGYHSLDFSILRPAIGKVRIKVRTTEMHEVAEIGVAAYLSYKEGKRSSNSFAIELFDWLSELIERTGETTAPKTFIEQYKAEASKNQIHCSTKGGAVIYLAKGATPIDFAYAIHPDVGSTCVGAKVDGLRVPLSTRLRNGQSVEIIRVESSQPERTWLDIANSKLALAAINNSLSVDTGSRP